MISDARPEDREQIALYILDIETDHKQGSDGTLVAVDKITFGKRGAPNYQMTWEVGRLKKDQPQIWEHFRPVYEKWQKDNTIAAIGHPLEAWPAITKGQIKICKSIGLRSVEDIAESTDAVREKFGMGFLDLRTQAKLFLESKAGAAQAHEMADLRRQNETLKQGLDEARAMIDQLMAAQGKKATTKAPRREAEAA